MAANVSNETFRTVVALVLLGIEFGSGGAGDTESTVPEREVRGTFA